MCVYTYMCGCLCMSVCWGSGGQGGGTRTEFGIPWRRKHTKEASGISILAQRKYNAIIRDYARESNSILLPHSWCHKVSGKTVSGKPERAGAGLKRAKPGGLGSSRASWGHHTTREWAENGHEVIHLKVVHGSKRPQTPSGSSFPHRLGKFIVKDFWTLPIRSFSLNPTSPFP